MHNATAKIATYSINIEILLYPRSIGLIKNANIAPIPPIVPSSTMAILSSDRYPNLLLNIPSFPSLLAKSHNPRIIKPIIPIIPRYAVEFSLTRKAASL